MKKPSKIFFVFLVIFLLILIYLLLGKKYCLPGFKYSSNTCAYKNVPDLPDGYVN